MAAPAPDSGVSTDYSARPREATPHANARRKFAPGSPMPVATAPAKEPHEPHAPHAPHAHPQTLSQALTEKIREFLTERHWSQRQFAKRLGVTQGAVSYLLAEKRRATVLDYYEQLAGVFGMPLSHLIADLEQRVGPAASDVPRQPTADSHAAPSVHADAETDPRRYILDRSAVLVESTLVRAFIEALLTYNAQALDTREVDRLLGKLGTILHAPETAPPPKRKRARRAAPSPPVVGLHELDESDQ